MAKALVTLAIGKNYELMFETYCRSLWLHYAEKYQFELVVFTQPLDTSSKSQSRNPSWQKCLILSQPSIQKYDRVVWVDADVLINPNSPDITAGVPLEKIGAVDDYATPSREDHEMCLKRLYDFLSQHGIEYIDNLSPTAFYKNFGLDAEFESVVQAGVMVLSPRYHRELLEYVYHSYEDKGSGEWNYEMRPLSYEILMRHIECWISPKFHMPWPLIQQFLYPFLNSRDNIVRKGLQKLGLNTKASLISKCVTTSFFNNYFLHFAGGTTGDMKYVDATATSIFDL
ncbi:hypothetical protein QUB63_11955 [Microcoleus sp. ARI1-B5]|uniref:hypothetical protein n=1 Tax=unclassified Microcoleus TaxID=2642155 RepID=UPI002FD56142